VREPRIPKGTIATGLKVPQTVVFWFQKGFEPPGVCGIEKSHKPCKLILENLNKRNKLASKFILDLVAGIVVLSAIAMVVFIFFAMSDPLFNGR